MSRYRDSSVHLSSEMVYRDPPPQRWDSNRFAREREFRRPPVAERPVYDDYRPSIPPAAPTYERERERYFDEDRYGPYGQRTERRYFEDDYYRDDPRAVGGVLVPVRPERPEPPVRPGQLIRRQSSLDTFDRRPIPRYEYYERPPPSPPRPYLPPPARAPRRGEASYDEVRIQDPEFYGDEGFREFREREWVRRRRRSPSASRSRSRERPAEFVEEVKEEKIEKRSEKPYPRKGKTRMPKRLVHTKALYDLGYPFYEEDEKTILIQKALGPENIDEVFALSKEYREREASTLVTTARLIEAPAEPCSPEIVEEKKTVEKTEIKTEAKPASISELTKSVEEWDDGGLKVPSSPKSHRSHKSRSRHRSRHRESVSKESFVEKTVVEKEGSPAPTHKTPKTSRSSVDDSETIIEKTKVVSDDDIVVGESNSVHVGPLALVVDRRPSRSDREIREEIRRLEEERRVLRSGRHRHRHRDRDRDDEYLRIERVEARSPSPRGEIILERGRDEVVEVRKDRRVRARSVGPGPGVFKAMIATLT